MIYVCIRVMCQNKSLIPRSYHLLDYDWTPLSRNPCWLSSVTILGWNQGVSILTPWTQYVFSIFFPKKMLPLMVWWRCEGTIFLSGPQRLCALGRKADSQGRWARSWSHGKRCGFGVLGCLGISCRSEWLDRFLSNMGPEQVLLGEIYFEFERMLSSLYPYSTQ